MVSRKKPRISILVIGVFCVLSLIAGGCSPGGAVSGKADQSAGVDISNGLICLKDGNTEELVGLAFGDEFDYGLFDIGGYSNGHPMYRLKNATDDGLRYFFDGQGHRFSGLAAYGGSGQFFGINLGEDTLEKVTGILGEPDEFEKAGNANDDSRATYLFKTAELDIYTNENSGMFPPGAIISVEYNELESLTGEAVPPRNPTEFDTDAQVGGQNVEAIYGEVYDDLKRTADYYDPRDGLFTGAQKASFIKAYLQKQGLYKEAPDGVALDSQGRPLAEYYIDRDKRIACFIIHEWGDYPIGADTGTQPLQTDAIYCATLHFDDSDRVGNLISSYDPERNITDERLYDAQGMRMASVSYEYVKNVPFPFISDSWNLNSGFDLIAGALCRNQKFWFYKEKAIFDGQGRFIGYDDQAQGDADGSDAGREYFTYPCECVYNADGSFSEIQEAAPKSAIGDEQGTPHDSADYSGWIKFSYGANDVMISADYSRSSYIHGTWDSSGTIYYDKNGRMTHNSYYVTHGGQDRIFLYDGDSKMPWACIYWDGFYNGFEQIYLFMPY